MSDTNLPKPTNTPQSSSQSPNPQASGVKPVQQLPTSPSSQAVKPVQPVQPVAPIASNQPSSSTPKPPFNSSQQSSFPNPALSSASKPMNSSPTAGGSAPKPVQPLSTNSSMGNTPGNNPGMPKTTPPVQPVSSTSPASANPGSPVPPTNPSLGGGVPPTPPKPGTPSPVTPGSAAPKKSILRFLPFLLIGLILIGAIGGAAYWFMNRGTTSAPVTGGEGQDTPVQKTVVTYWGLWEPSTVMEEVIAEFETQNPTIDIQYTQQNHQEYRERLQVAITNGDGPDIFRYHASWVPMLSADLSPLPEKIMTREEYAQTFYPVATTALSRGNDLVGIPLMYEGLGLYYNKQIFEVADLAPPQTWEDVKSAAELLTIRDGSTITRGGIALGTTSNVDNFSDILGLMLWQNGAKISDPVSQEAVDAVDFYKSFVTEMNVWDATLPSSTVAFGRGDVAMMIAPSWRVHEIRATNPNLEFGIVQVPQLPETDQTTWASFWAEGVSAKSSQKEISWKFLEYLSTPEVLRKFHSEAKKVRAFGEIYPRQDMAEELKDDEYQAAYLLDAPYAQIGFLSSNTFDNGINDRIIKYYEDGLNSTSSDTAKNLETVKLGVQQVLQQFLPAQ